MDTFPEQYRLVAKMMADPKFDFLGELQLSEIRALIEFIIDNNKDHEVITNLITYCQSDSPKELKDVEDLQAFVIDIVSSSGKPKVENHQEISPISGNSNLSVLREDLIHVIQDARHRIVNLSRNPVPNSDSLDGPVIKRLDELRSKLLCLE